jgi:type VI secretion system protein ImpC
MADPLPIASADPATDPELSANSFFEELINRDFRPKTSEARTAIKDAVQTLAEQALQGTKLISNEAVRNIEAMIAEIDRKISDQVNGIIHHQDFKDLEGAWRGFHHLVSHTETDENLKIKFLNVSKKELSRTLRSFKGSNWDQSPLYKKVYGEGYDTPGGHPYGVLIGDYYFDHTAPDVGLLSGIAKVAAAAHVPFITGASPTLMNMETWQQLGDPSDLAKVVDTAEYIPWKSLRKSEDSRYLGLVMPRFLARLPYDPKNNPVEGFTFKEDIAAADHDKYIWANAAYAMGARITDAFKKYGWCARIRGVESGGMVEDLPCHTFPTDDGGIDLKCPTEIAITERRGGELDKAGLIPLYHWQNTDYAVFLGAQSLQAPAEYTHPDATANANLSARLNYMFAVCRFAHYLKCIARDKIGSFKEREDMERWLNDWINQYVTSDPTASERVKSENPLREAKVEVEAVPGNPGYYTSKFWLRPHFQLEGLRASLRLVSKLPSAKGAT